MRRALAGIGVSSAGLRRNSGGSARPLISPASTIPRVCATRGVVRRITGRPDFSESVKAKRVIAHASAGVEGSRTGIMFIRARCRWSCSFGETIIPGSPAETMTIPAITPT